MPSAIASSVNASWSGPAESPSGGWRLGASLGAGMQWVLRRNCALTPSQLGAVYLSLCVLSMVIATPFAFHGAAVVLAFAGLELLIVGAAMLVFARHVRDGETLTLSGQTLHVEQCNGSRTSHTEFRAEWVSVEPAHGESSLVELSGQGRHVRVGRFLRPEMRPTLAHELRHALRSVRGQPSPDHHA
jgi:uncharacterized membrane protein